MTESKPISFKLPNQDSPGFLKRQRDILEIQAAIRTAPIPGMKRLVKHLLPYVSEPADPKAAEELIWDLSEAALTEVINALTRSQVSPKD